MEKTLWSDSHPITDAADGDTYNLYEDIKCQKERIAELEHALRKSHGIEPNAE